MKITEFLNGRDVERQAVTRYISRHDEIFNQHVTRDGKELDIDNYAFSVLDSVYPLAKPVTVVDGVPHEEYERLQTELIKAQREKAELQNRLLETTEQLATTNATKILLEDKNVQIEKLENEKAELKAEIEKIREQLESEKSKTWLDKLFKK